MYLLVMGFLTLFQNRVLRNCEGGNGCSYLTFYIPALNYNSIVCVWIGSVIFLLDGKLILMETRTRHASCYTPVSCSVRNGFLCGIVESVGQLWSSAVAGIYSDFSQYIPTMSVAVYSDAIYTVL